MILYIGNKNSITPSTIDTLGEQLKERHEIVTCCENKNKLLRFINMFFKIVLLRKECTLIIVDTYSTWNFYYAFMTSILGKLFNIPYIPILHGGNLPQRVEKSPKMSHYIFSHAAINITPSLYLQASFDKEGYKTTHIPNNIRLEDYPHQLREDIAPKLLYVRSFAEIYNTNMAIRVLKNILSTHPQASLCMVGPDRDGSLEKTKAYAQELGVDAHVTFTGGLSKEAWISLSCEYDIFINTTNFDNLPVSIVEAMALGFPIVSTNTGGLPYLIEDGVDGLLVDKNDDIGMSKKIVQLLQEPKLCKSLSANGRKKAQNYDWKVIKKLWDNLIEEYS